MKKLLQATEKALNKTEDERKSHEDKSRGIMGMAGQRESMSGPGRFALEISGANAKIKELEEKVQSLAAQGSLYARMIKLDELVEAPGRRRHLTPEEYEELKDKLRSSKLIHPVTVFQRQDGRYEIISGNNRTRVYKDLGRTEIECYVIDIDEGELKTYSFLANMVPALTAYEHYRGFLEAGEEYKSKTGKNWTFEILHQITGKPISTIQRYMCFDEFSDEALRILEERPSALGVRAASDMAKILKEARKYMGERWKTPLEVVIRKMVSGSYESDKAAANALEYELQQVNGSGGNSTQKTAKKVELFKLERGGKSIMSVVPSNSKTLSIKFSSEGEMKALQDKIVQLLQELK